MTAILQPSLITRPQGYIHRRRVPTKDSHLDFFSELDFLKIAHDALPELLQRSPPHLHPRGQL